MKIEFTTSESSLSLPTSIYMTTDKTYTRVAEIGNYRGVYTMYLLSAGTHLTREASEALKKFAADWILVLNITRKLLK